MKKNKLNYEAALKQMDKLLPEDIVDANKNGITACKDEGKFTVWMFFFDVHKLIHRKIQYFFKFFIANGIKDACEAGYVLVQCMYKNNEKFTFA